MRILLPNVMPGKTNDASRGHDAVIAAAHHIWASQRPTSRSVRVTRANAGEGQGGEALPRAQLQQLLVAAVDGVRSRVHNQKHEFAKLKHTAIRAFVESESNMRV